MKEEDFKKLIKFRETRTEFGVRLEAWFIFSASMTIDEREMHRSEAYAKEKLTEMLLRHVYEDRRKEFYDSILDLHKANPMSNEYHNTVDKVLSLAKRQ